MERFVNIVLRLGLRPGGSPHYAENETCFLSIATCQKLFERGHYQFVIFLLWKT